MNFPFISGNIPAASAYGVYIYLNWSDILELVISYHNYLDRGLLLTRKILDQEFPVVKLKSSLRKFYGHRHGLRLTATEYMCHKWPRICSVCRNRILVLSPLMTFHRIYNKSNTTGATCGARTAYPSGAPEFAPDLVGFVLLDL